LSRRPQAIQNRAASSAGFTILELLLVIAIGVTLAAFGLIRIQGGLAAFRANGSMSTLKAKLQSARELAISRQRDIAITINGTTGVTFYVVNPDATQTQVDKMEFESGVTFTTFGGQGTPSDTWCSDAANLFRNLNTKTTLRFNSDGALIDSTTRNIVSGCFYMGRAGEPETSRSVSLFGGTGRARTYKWSATTWIH
jgi:prepilin-type N-terminal cleavage/methylation domain-containing protein